MLDVRFRKIDRGQEVETSLVLIKFDSQPSTDRQHVTKIVLFQLLPNTYLYKKDLARV